MPLDDRIVELINTVVDGEATAEEQALLQTVISSSPEAQQQFESTRRIAERLDSAERVAPPPGIRQTIMASVIQRPARGRGRVASPGSARAKRRVWFGAAWAAAAALVVGVVAIGPAKLTGWRNSGATMAPQVEADGSVVATIRATASPARLTVLRDGELIVLEPVIGRPATVSLSWDPAAASAVAFSQAQDASSGKGQFTFSTRPGGGRGRVTLRPRAGLRSLEVTMSVDSKQVLRAVVPLG